MGPAIVKTRMTTLWSLVLTSWTGFGVFRQIGGSFWVECHTHMPPVALASLLTLCFLFFLLQWSCPQIMFLPPICMPFGCLGSGGASPVGTLLLSTPLVSVTITAQERKVLMKLTWWCQEAKLGWFQLLIGESSLDRITTYCVNSEWPSRTHTQKCWDMNVLGGIRTI